MKKKNFIKLFLFLNFSILNIIINLTSNLRVLICTIGKEENKYIKEFVEHYRKLKVKKIILYDNNNINGEKFEDILQNEINDNFIKIINYRGYDIPQIKALNDCYKKNKYKYDWIAFYDIDEFLYINNFTDINKFLSLPKFKKCQSLLINWKYYGDNDKLNYEPKPLSERFIKPINIAKNKKIQKDKYFFSASKTIVRGGLKLNWGMLPHFFNNTINCKPNGRIINNYFSPLQHSIAYIKHYITKSTEEFIEKLKRGDVLVKINTNYIENRINNYYFLFNKKTKEKVALFKKKLKYKMKS